MPKTSCRTDLDRRRVIKNVLGMSSFLTAPGLLASCGGSPVGPDLEHIHNVQILSLQTSTPDSNVLRLRQKDESIIDFAKREIEDRQLKLAQALASALIQLKHDPFRPYVTFFSAPELYWNIPWTVLRNEDELRRLTKFYQSEIKRQVQQLIKKFPVSEWGRLVLLPGTNALLVPSKEYPERHEAVNCVWVANNVGPLSEQGTPYLSMWPKRNVAGIDFGVFVDLVVLEDGETILFTFQLAEGIKVKVSDVSSARAEHDTRSGFVPLFDNRVLPTLPFGIDICADFGLTRLAELMQPDVKLDFLLAAGQVIPRDISAFDFPESLQYVIRNDGVASKGLQCEVLYATKSRRGERVPGRLLDQNVWLYQLDVK